MADEDVYVCPAGEKLAYSFTTQDKGMVLRRYRTTARHSCAIKNSCTKGKERLISRWEHEHIIEAVQRRLDEHPERMRQRRETVEHPFGTIKARMGATHFLMKTLPRVASEMATRAGLQSDPGHEHHGHSAAHGRDEGLGKPEKRLLNATRPKLLRFDTSGKTFLHNQDPAPPSRRHHTPRLNRPAAARHIPCRSVLARLARAADSCDGRGTDRRRACAI